MPVCAAKDMSTDSPPWCLVINVSADSLVRSRRSLHNALMQLEREGAIVVERHITCADLALSESTCCCIWTEQSLKVSFYVPDDPHGAWFLGQVITLCSDISRHDVPSDVAICTCS